LAWLATLALSGQVLGWLLVGVALPRLHAAVGATLLLLQPVLSILLAALLLGERPHAGQLLGSAAVLATVWFATAGNGPAAPRTRRRPQSIPDDAAKDHGVAPALEKAPYRT
jgi:drug/metabolite transporter (DMT)-like permease